VLQHVSVYRRTIIREPCTVLGSKLQEWFYRVCWQEQGRCYGSIFWPVVRVCSSLYMKAVPSYTVNHTHIQGSLMIDPLWSETCWSTFKYFIALIVSTYYILCISWIIKCLIIIDARCKHEERQFWFNWIRIRQFRGLNIRTQRAGYGFYTRRSLRSHLCESVAYRGGVWGVQTPPPRNSEGPSKSCQTQPDCKIC
jgi:hypothetical protein